MKAITEKRHGICPKAFLNSHMSYWILACRGPKCSSHVLPFSCATTKVSRYRKWRETFDGSILFGIFHLASRNEGILKELNGIEFCILYIRYYNMINYRAQNP